MFSERRVVDNRTFLLGLDGLYRESMKKHERVELLSCARVVAGAIGVGPADVPVEGYYAEDAALTEYFRLIKALQTVNASAKPVVEMLPEFVRLVNVVSAPLFGRPQYHKLLPIGRDALSEALWITRPHWTMLGLTNAAFESAYELDDFSLVGLAARIRETVVLAATRESVVLYAEKVLTARPRSWKPPSPYYVWEVDDDLASHAARFVDTFNALFGDELPAPDADNAASYWSACQRNVVLGRCVCLGWDEDKPPRHYHWAIRKRWGGLEVHDFWDRDLWTTQMYRAKLGLIQSARD